MKTYEEIAKKHNLPLDTAERFIMYMRRRWGDPKDEAIICQGGYASEWAKRFFNMIEYSASDNIGQQILREIDNPKE